MRSLSCKRIILLLIIVMGMSGCDAPPSIDKKDVIIRAGSHKGEIKKLNPWDKALFANNLIPLMHVKLVTYTQHFDIAPMLAESWIVAEDGKSITFHLRRNAKWHDGRPVTSGDVQFSLMLCKKHERWSRLAEFIEKVEAPDAYTVRVDLMKSTALYLLHSWLPTTTIILPEHIWKDVNIPREFNDPKALIGCGPFIFDGYDPVSQTVSLKADADYFDGKPAIDGILWKQFKSFDGMFLAMMKGDIDVVLEYHSPVPRSYMKRPSDPGVKLFCAPEMGVPANILFNCRKQPMNDRRFREAIAFALDYGEIIEAVADGQAVVPTRGFVPPSYPFYRSGLPALSRDIGKAEKLLDDLGFFKSTDGLRQDKEGKTLSFDLLVQQGSRFPYLVQTAELVARQLRKVGIDARPAVYEFFLADKKLFGERSYDICIGRFMPLDILAGCGTLLFADSPGNMGTCGDKKLISLAERFYTAKNEEAMREAAWDLQDYYAAELPGIALYHADACFLCRTDRFEGWTPMCSGVANYWSWFSVRPMGD